VLKNFFLCFYFIKIHLQGDRKIVFLQNNIKKIDMMTVEEVVALVEGQIVGGAQFKDQQVECVFASDLMSDVLTLRNEKSLMLMTGLCNLQAIRTCEMSDICIVLFVRGKKVTPEMIELAEDNEMVLIETNFSMFKSSGILYGAGIPPIY